MAGILRQVGTILQGYQAQTGRLLRRNAERGIGARVSWA